MRMVLTAFVLAVNVIFPLTPVQGACPTEDSPHCVWDAARQGDGNGRSFINVLAES